MHNTIYFLWFCIRNVNFFLFGNYLGSETVRSFSNHSNHKNLENREIKLLCLLLRKLLFRAVEVVLQKLISEALLGWVHMSLVWISKPVFFHIEEEAMSLSSFYHCFALVFIVVTVWTHLSVVCHYFICFMSLFQGHVACQNFVLTGPGQWSFWWLKPHQLHVPSTAFLGNHLLWLAFGLCICPHPSPFIFSLINQCHKALFQLVWRLMAGRHRCTSHGDVTLSRGWLCQKWKPLDILGTHLHK